VKIVDIRGEMWSDDYLKHLVEYQKKGFKCIEGENADYKVALCTNNNEVAVLIWEKYWQFEQEELEKEWEEAEEWEEWEEE